MFSPSRLFANLLFLLRFMLQKLLFLLPPGDADSEVEKRQREMMVKCGRTIQELQAAHL